MNPHEDRARDLLFGLIALQVGLIDQARLVAGFQAWTLDKSRPLAEHLIALGHLDAERRAAIEAMAAFHLKIHGDAEKSLASLGIGHSTRERLASLADPEIDATISHVGPGVTPGDGDRTPTYHVGSSTSDGQRFRVLRPHAQGGLGAVFVALDGELNREVALKQILDGHADDPHSRHRFVLEAEITGGLEHPGIVPVYGLGAYQDGRPYYAMRFIRGDSLKQAIQQFHVGWASPTVRDQAKRTVEDGGPCPPYETTRSVAFRKLLRRFLDVCNAIDYAHSRGVLHRDLKPGNVIVGKYGETLVVDWGLAKALGKSDPLADERTLTPSSASGSSETLPGQTLGTPAYMSPEQARGDLDALGPRSDVYSLGATLYCLLTGKAPFEGKVLEVLQAVKEGTFPPPRAVDPTIDKALEAIVLKAMATKPEDRYASCQALAEDTERWLADERVAAYSEPWTRTLNRWLTRHRTSVTGAAAALLVALVGLGVVSAVQTKARNELDRTNGELTEANTRVTTANAELTAANQALEIQRNRAEANETEAINAVKKFRDAVTGNDELMDNPALEGLRKTLLREPLTFFRALRERLQADRDTRPEALARLASAAFELGSLSSDIGDKPDAVTAYRESLAIQRKLADDHPTVTLYQRELAASHNNLGGLLSATGQPDAARASFGSALAIQRKLADDHPTVTQYQSELAGSHNNLGFLLSETGQPAAARASYESALAIERKLADDHPAVTQYQRALAASHNNLGLLLSATGEPDAARASYESALAIRRKLADDHPTVTLYQRDLAASHNNLGILLGATGEPDAARTAYEAALAIQRKLADDRPTVTQYQRELATSHNNFGNLLRATGQPDASRASYEAALTIRRKLADDHPTVTQHQSELAASHHNLGLLLSATGQPEAAQASYEAALAIRRKLADDHPESPEYASELGVTLNNLATLDLEDKHFAEARDRLREAVRWQKKALAVNPRSPTFRQFLAGHYTNLRKAAQGLDDADLRAEADSGLAELKASDPRLQALDVRLAAILKGEAPKDTAERLALAQQAYDTKRYALAAKLWAEAMEADPKVAADRQKQYPYDAACAAALTAAGQGIDDPPPDDAAKAKLREQALGWLKAELAIWSKFVASGPPQAKAFIAQNLKHWQEDTDLASIRDTEALDKLPEEEQAAWKALWAEVAVLLGRAQAEAISPPSSP